MPVLGSSNNINAGSPIALILTESLRFIPPENVETRSWATESSPTMASFSSASKKASAYVIPCLVWFGLVWFFFFFKKKRKKKQKQKTETKTKQTSSSSTYFLKRVMLILSSQKHMKTTYNLRIKNQMLHGSERFEQNIMLRAYSKHSSHLGKVLSNAQPTNLKLSA